MYRIFLCNFWPQVKPIVYIWADFNLLCYIIFYIHASTMCYRINEIFWTAFVYNLCNLISVTLISFQERNAIYYGLSDFNEGTKNGKIFHAGVCSFLTMEIFCRYLSSLEIPNQSLRNNHFLTKWPEQVKVVLLFSFATFLLFIYQFHAET